MLPKGQFDLGEMPRFGLPEYRDRFPTEIDQIQIAIGGDVTNHVTLQSQLETLPSTSQISDFHCVTTWSATGLNWEGWLFRDFFEHCVVPLAQPASDATYVNIKCQDGYRSCLPLDDMLRDNVMLATHLNGDPLSIANGAPLRLVAPDHYGYKNAKHIREINFHRDEVRPKTALTRFLAHPRGRVALEERGVGAPGWLLRYLYRPLIPGTRRGFEKSLRDHLAKGR